MRESDPIEGFEQRGASRTLVVILHAYTSSPARMTAVRDVVADCFPDADLLVPALPTGLLSTHSPQAIVRGLLGTIDSLWAARAGGYRSIVLVGHSIGALLARKLYVCACGADAHAPFEPELADPQLAAPVIGLASADLAEWLKTVLLMLYALLIWKVVTVL